MTPEQLGERWRTRATELERYAAPVAAAFRDAADELEAALAEQADAELTVSEGSAESGYSPRRLREMVAEGLIPAVEGPGPTRIRRANLPRKARPRTNGGAYDVAADARQLVSRM